MEVVKDAITYLYTAGIKRLEWEWGNLLTSSAEGFSYPTQLAKVYIFGDKWDIPALQQYIVQLWRLVLFTKPYKVPDILRVISMVWHSICDPDDSLKLVIADMVRTHLQKFHYYDDFIAALSQVPEASAAIVNSIAVHNDQYRMIEIPVDDECQCDWEETHLEQCESCRTLQYNRIQNMLS